MSFLDETTPKKLVAGLTKLLEISDPKLFMEHLSALKISGTDSVDIVAEKIKEWCETRPKIGLNLESKIYQLSACGTDIDDAPEEVVRELYEVVKKNKIRLGLSEDSVADEAPAVETAATQTMSASADEEDPGAG